MLSGISVICFAASYTITFLLEVSRLFVRVVARSAVSIGFAVAGSFAHGVFLYYRWRELSLRAQPPVTWYTGCLLLAWFLVLIYLVSRLASRESVAGLFLLPTSLVLIGMAHVFPRTPQGIHAWRQLHGWSLLIGMVLVAFGFATGLLYLLQSFRLKQHRLPMRRGVGLPSLERLQWTNEQCLVASVGFLAFGLVTGILLNAVRIGSVLHPIPWTDPVVIASLVWLVWLILVAVFSGIYRPARQGRKVAYLTTGSFVFVAIVMLVMRYAPTQHGVPSNRSASTSPPAALFVRGPSR